MQLSVHLLKMKFKRPIKGIHPITSHSDNRERLPMLFAVAEGAHTRNGCCRCESALLGSQRSLYLLSLPKNDLYLVFYSLSPKVIGEMHRHTQVRYFSATGLRKDRQLESVLFVYTSVTGSTKFRERFTASCIKFCCN